MDVSRFEKIDPASDHLDTLQRIVDDDTQVVRGRRLLPSEHDVAEWAFAALR